MSPYWKVVEERYPAWLKADLAVLSEKRISDHILELREMLGRVFVDDGDAPESTKRWLHNRSWLLDRECPPVDSERW